jgi:thioesterase domain-containing protein
MSTRFENVEDICELAPLQREVLNRERQSPAGLAPLQWVYRIDGLDVPAFIQACQAVVARHPILRTSFHHEGMTRAVQVVRRRAALPVGFLDWRGLTPADQVARLASQLEQERTRRFALTQAPLVRLTVVRSSEDGYRHLWSYHPILWDGPSRSLFFQEVFACYQAARLGRDFRPPPPCPYRDYIVWLQQQDRTRAEAFWRQSLEGFTAPTPVTEGPPGGQRRRTFAVERLRLSPLFAAALRRAIGRRGLTLNAAVHGAWALLLALHSGRTDLVFGTTVAGRPAELPGAESSLGLFANNLPVRVSLPAEAPLIGWLQRLHEHLEEVSRFGYLPLARVRGWSALPPNQPIFHTLVTYDQAGGSEAPWNRGVKVSPLRRMAQQGNHPLVGMLGRNGATLRIAYARDCFDAKEIRRMLGQMRRTLAVLIANPEQSLGRLLAPRRPSRAPTRPGPDDPGLELLLGLDIASRLRQDGSASDAVLLPLQTRGSRPPFFCIHPAGATALCYEPLARHLGPDQPVFALQPPLAGAGHGQASLDEMAQRCLEALRSVQPEGPYSLGGWSVGGVTAFAVARKLLEQGQPVALLALFDTSQPAKAVSPSSIRKVVARGAGRLRLGVSLDFFFQQLTQAEQCRFVLEAAGAAGVFPADVTPEDFRRHAWTFKDYLRAVREYPLGPYPGRVVLFRPEESLRNEREDPTMGWNRFAAEVELQVVPGNHATLVLEPHVKHLAEKLRACLER